MWSFAFVSIDTTIAPFYHSGKILPRKIKFRRWTGGDGMNGQPGGRAAGTMLALRLNAAGGPAALSVDRLPVPEPGPGEALVRVHAAGITRDELEWPTDRLPAIPSYELSGVVVAVGPGVAGIHPGEVVWALTPFDRDGVAAEFAAVPAALLAPKPVRLGHRACAAIPLAGLSAWQGLFDHGLLEPGQRVLVHGAGGGVGRFAVQLARWRGAHVVGTASPAGMEAARNAGADEVVDRSAADFGEGMEPVDLVFDTVGGAVLGRSDALVRAGGGIVTVADRPPAGVKAAYFVVEPRREQLVRLGRLVDSGDLEPALDSVFPLIDGRGAFERVAQSGKRGKVVLGVADDDTGA
jgi:NADPH:quinone reductase-like Zn-dependent oxidoreductase